MQHYQAGTNIGQQQQQQLDNEAGKDNIVYIRGTAIERVYSF
jgi:hypothetical protein